MPSQDPNDYTNWCPICAQLANCADLNYLEAGIITHGEVNHIKNKPFPDDRDDQEKYWPKGKEK